MAVRSYEKEFSLLQQVHLALGAASTLDDFYVVLASCLVDPGFFGFSRAFLLRYDDRQHVYTGRLALGASSVEEHQEFRSDLIEEAKVLQQQIAQAQAESPEPHSIQSLYDLRAHAVWVRLLQGEQEGTGLNADFRNIRIRRDSLEPSDLIEAVSNCAHARVFNSGATIPAELARYLTFPVVAARLQTKRGLHGLLIADRLFEKSGLNHESAYHFQWLVNHASVTLDNLELVDEMTQVTQRLQEVDRLKSSFLSIVSHELRTPLTSIIGFVHLLTEQKAGPIAEPQLDLLRRIAHHSQHLHGMVNDLLEIAEVESGGMVNTDPGPIDPLVAVVNTIAKVEARRGRKDLHIEPVITASVPQILCDVTSFERICFHLLDNALKFTRGPAGRVTVEFERRGGELDIAICDTGIGISPDHLKRIFDHFYQVDFRLERAYSGLGIGLSVVKMLLEASGGKISAESKLGQGSRFTITYPVAESLGEPEYLDD